MVMKKIENKFRALSGRHKNLFYYKIATISAEIVSEVCRRTGDYEKVYVLTFLKNRDRPASFQL